MFTSHRQRQIGKLLEVTFSFDNYSMSVHWIANKAHNGELTIIITCPTNLSAITGLLKGTPKIMYIEVLHGSHVAWQEQKIPFPMGKVVLSYA